MIEEKSGSGENQEGSTARTTANATMALCTCETITRGHRVARAGCPVHPNEVHPLPPDLESDLRDFASAFPYLLNIEHRPFCTAMYCEKLEAGPVGHDCDCMDSAQRLAVRGKALLTEWLARKAK